MNNIEYLLVHSNCQVLSELKLSFSETVFTLFGKNTFSSKNMFSFVLKLNLFSKAKQGPFPNKMTKLKHV